MSTTAPFGSWVSPLSAEAAAVSGVRFGRVILTDTSVLWSETLPDEGGRSAVMIAPRPGVRGAGSVGPSEFAPSAVVSARSRVNEYGGGSFWFHGDPRSDGRLFWVNAETQRINSVRANSRPLSLTASPPAIRAWRYASGSVTPDGRWVICEREMHVDPDGVPLPEAVNDLVAINTMSGEIVCLIGPDDIGGGDFIASPALSPDGSALCWLRWDHPDMPWDAAELWAADLDVNDDLPRIGAPRRVAGGIEGGRAHGMERPVSVCLPRWSPEGQLFWCDDSNNWWNLYSSTDFGVPAEGSGDVTATVFDLPEAEIGEARWVAGGSRYGFTQDGRIVFAMSSDGLDSLWIGDPPTGHVVPVDGPHFTYVENLDVSGTEIAIVAGTSDSPTSVWVLDLQSGRAEDLRNASSPIPRESVAAPEAVTFLGSDGSECHAILYRPANSQFCGPNDELPPLLVRIHGGPTASARPELSASVQFWTTRGFAVADVNYRGSTGYGREFRDQLKGQWGVADVQDCISVARHLAEDGVVDPVRCVIRGGSAGGFTSLAALCFQHDWGYGATFAAACSLYGVTDLASLAADTHKFESRYLDGLVGKYPEQADLYRQRSPLFHADNLCEPVLLLQGSEDKIVPASQAEVLVSALAKRGVPHAYVLFQGEGHGFLHTETVVTALETELAFYGQVLGFEPADDLAVLDLD